MPIELHKPATTVSDNLRALVAVTVALPDLLRAMFDVGYFPPNTPPHPAGPPVIVRLLLRSVGLSYHYSAGANATDSAV